MRGAVEIFLSTCTLVYYPPPPPLSLTFPFPGHCCKVLLQTHRDLGDMYSKPV